MMLGRHLHRGIEIDLPRLDPFHRFETLQPA